MDAIMRAYLAHLPLALSIMSIRVNPSSRRWMGVKAAIRRQASRELSFITLLLCVIDGHSAHQYFVHRVSFGVHHA